MKVLILVHSDLVPPNDVIEKDYDWAKVPWVTEYEVNKCLSENKYDVKILGAQEDLKNIRESIEDFQPHITFNLLEEFKGEAIFDQNVVSYLELLGAPYTGCNPKGMTLARDKALSKKILAFHKIKTPRFQVFPRNQPHRKIRLNAFPAIVKCLNEEASLGLSQASVVKNPEKLKERVKFIHDNFKTDAIAEEFIKGQEFFVGVMGNYRLKVLPVWQLNFKDAKNPESQWYSTNAKFNTKYRERNGITTSAADIDDDLKKRLQKASKKAYQVLGLSGYARMDLRYGEDGNVYLIEANPNPDISEFDDFAMSAKASGFTYVQLLDKIMRLGRQWNPY